MKKKIHYILITLLLVLLSINVTAQNGESNFSKNASAPPQLVQNGPEKVWCPVCGMSLKMFFKTSHAAQHGTTKNNRQYCSMRCLLVDMQEHDIDLKTVQVVDVPSEILINANSAHYVVGSGVPGTMSKVSKLAFAKKEDAEAFAQKRGGSVVDLKTALITAKESLNSDIAMINKKKQKKMHPMGKKVFESMCDQAIDPNRYSQINELKADIKINHLCGKSIDPRKLQAVSLYLWEVKRLSKQTDTIIHVKKNEKCPVCGMFVYKYPKWAAQIFYSDNSTHFSFDGVKDLMKFFFEPDRWVNQKISHDTITEILVTDYYTQQAINGKAAYYVIGSDVIGPMGNELIPFKHESDAKTFMHDHKGSKIIKFDQITKEEVARLDQ